MSIKKGPDPPKISTVDPVPVCPKCGSWCTPLKDGDLCRNGSCGWSTWTERKVHKPGEPTGDKGST